MSGPIYEIYIDHGNYQELIGNLYLDTILAIHKDKIMAICDINYEVYVRP